MKEVSINEKMKLSEHFSLGELTKTSYITADGNIPSHNIKCYGPEHMIRMAGILLDIADGTKRDFDELIQEKRGSTYWIHFAVRPKDNRRKILFDCR